MAFGNYEAAAEIFKKIMPQIDNSLYFYCSAYANFLKGKAANANQLVKKALHLNDTKQEYLVFETPKNRRKPSYMNLTVVCVLTAMIK